MDTTPLRSFTTRPGHPNPITKHRADFARQAVRLEFGPRNARSLDQGDFEDRLPHERPRHIGQVAPKVTRQSGQNSLRHWLNQAGRADTDEEYEAALKIARNIARLRVSKLICPDRGLPDD